jgi:hypothetical protein
MRIRTLLATVLLAGCAHAPWFGSAPKPQLTISEDGQTVTAGGERWTAPEGVAFYQRGSALRVVANAPGRSWDVAVAVGEGGKLAWPADAPFEARDGALHLRTVKADPEVALLIDTAQLHPHDDHFHLTHRYMNEDWQTLYRLREEDSPLPPIRRQIAATVLALLLDERLPGSSPEATAKALHRMVSIIGKARRALEAETGARAIEAIITHDFEIRDEGRTVEIEGKVFRAAEPLRFAYCANHFHVEEATGKWAQPVDFESPSGGFAWPGSIFFEIRPDGTVGERPPSSRWRRLSDSGQVRFTRDHWHITEAYDHPRLQAILKTVANPALGEALKDKARALALDVMRLRLDTGSDAEFEARLDAIDQAIDRAGAELEKEAPKAAAPAKKR